MAGPSASCATSGCLPNHLVQPDLIAQVALQKREGLPKTGKPQPHEWTVMAAIVACDTSCGDPALRVLTLATGTKCLGASQRDPGGLALGDCHAEVLTRRALLRYLCAEANALLGEDSQQAPGGCGAGHRILERWERPDGRAAFRLRPAVTLHLFISQPPCGDACVIVLDAGRSQGEQSGASAPRGELISGGALQLHRDQDLATLKSLPATGRTGAKLLVLPKSDGSAAPAVVTDAHASCLGQEAARCRRKPGRGESTLSMSCSDKIARWSLLGLQGSLWSALLAAPLALSSVTVVAPLGVDPALTKVALRRALVRRTDALRVKTQLPPPTVHVLAPDPEVLERLALAPLGGRRVSCGASLAWHDGVAAAAPPFHEGLTGGTGLRAGHARKPGQAIRPVAASKLCRRALAVEWAGLLRRLGPIEKQDVEALQHTELKRLWAPDYQALWSEIKAGDDFRAWIPKPLDARVIDGEDVSIDGVLAAKRQKTS